MEQFLWIIYKISVVRKVAVDLVREMERSGSSGQPPRSCKVVESIYKYLQTHTEVINCVLVRVPINNN